MNSSNSVRKEPELSVEIVGNQFRSLQKKYSVFFKPLVGLYI